MKGHPPTITVSCSCDCGVCNASYSVSGFGFGAADVGEAGSNKGQDYFVTDTGIIAFASGKTVSAHGFLGWSHFNEKAYNEYGYGGFKHIQSGGQFVSFKWTCKGVCN